MSWFHKLKAPMPTLSAAFKSLCACLSAMTFLLYLTEIAAQGTYDWEGVWAQTKSQCLCEFYSIDTCADGGGLPPLLINREKLTGPEISCRIVRRSNLSRT